jgi:two-component system, OmpR family, response regulator
MALRVLYIDDDRINSLLFEEICRLAGGVTVELAGSGDEALAVAPGFAPQLLVIDLHLPDTDGLALLPRLRQALQQPELPAFLCTADIREDVPLAARHAGFAGCWSKPVNLGELTGELARRSNPPPPASSPA